MNVPEYPEGELALILKLNIEGKQNRQKKR